MRPKKNRRKTGEANQHWLTINTDNKAAIFQFAETFLPLIKTAQQKGWSADEILRHMENLAALRIASEMATEGALGLAAAKDMLDRAKGKAVERKEVAHRLGNLPEKELDALLASKLAVLEGDSDE